tara:strand:+ start:451 stop:621 length:171 start_codon:yes stop_codon:yes gene_type:complete
MNQEQTPEHQGIGGQYLLWFLMYLITPLTVLPFTDQKKGLLTHNSENWVKLELVGT